MKENESFEFIALVLYAGNDYSVKCKKTRLKDEIIIDSILNIPIPCIHDCQTIGAIRFTYTPPNGISNIVCKDELIAPELIAPEMYKITYNIGEQVPLVPTGM